MANKLLILIGPSGCGKTTFGKRLEQVTNSKIAVSHTSRQPRQGEVDGVDYNFVTESKFLELISSKQITQWVLYSGNYYGLMDSELDLTDNNVIAIVEPSGATEFKSKFKEKAVVVYLETYVNSQQEYAERMLSRGDTQETVDKRMSTLASFEDYKKCCDLVLYEPDPVIMLDNLKEILDA